MRWVTQQDVGLDRMACAWLIRHWIDPQADIHYLAAEAIPAEVEAGALPFHNTADEEATWEERSSFPQLLAEYKLDARDPALVRLAAIVQGAEQDADAVPPESTRLAARLAEVKARVRADAEVVAQMRPVLDALYAECRLSNA